MPPTGSYRHVYIRPGQSGRAEMPCSEVCLHLGVAGRVLDFTLSPHGDAVQLLDPDGTPLSAPILAGEAGIQNDPDGRCWYPAPPMRTCAGCGLPVDRAADGTWFVTGTGTGADGLSYCPPDPDCPEPDEPGGHVPIYACDPEALSTGLLSAASYEVLRRRMPAGQLICDRMARAVASWWQSPGGDEALARLAGTGHCGLPAVRDAVRRELREIRRRGAVPAGHELVDLLAWAEHRIAADGADR